MKQSRGLIFLAVSIFTSFITTIFLYFGWIPPIGAGAIILGLGGLSIIKLNNLEKLYQKVFRPLYSYAIIGFLILLIIRGLAYTTWIQSIPIAVDIIEILGKIEIILVAHIIALPWVLTALDKKFASKIKQHKQSILNNFIAAFILLLVLIIIPITPISILIYCIFSFYIFIIIKINIVFLQNYNNILTLLFLLLGGAYLYNTGFELQLWTLILTVLSLIFLTTDEELGSVNYRAKITLRKELLGLSLILILFTLFKLPYFSVSFTGEHTMKYSTHVEPALYMYENNNFLHYQKKYLSDPISNPTGEFSTFGIFPIHEWGIASLLYAFPNLKLEILVRIWTHIIGLGIIISFYQFLKRFIDKENALLVTALVSVSPIILFLSFVTVVDSILLITTFVSLIYQDKFLKKKGIWNLLYSGIIIGLGVISKISIYLWIVPMLVVTGLLSKQKYYDKIRSILLPLGISFLVFLMYRKSLINLPANPLESILLFGVFFTVLLGGFYFYTYKGKALDNFLEYLLKNKFFLFILTAISLTFGIIILQYFGLARLSGEFLTDKYLIFNIKLYHYMAWYQFRPFVGNVIFGLATIGVLLFAFNSNVRVKWKSLVWSMLAGSVIYWVLASKSIYIHNYYTGIIVISLVLLASITVSFILNNMLNNYLNILFIPLMAVSMFFINISTIDQLLGRETEHIGEFTELSDFLAETMDQDELFIDDSYMLSAGIYGRRTRMASGKLFQDQIVADIEELGFANAMEKYNIKYLVTRYSPFRASSYARLFVNEPFEPSTGYDRSERIRRELGQSVTEIESQNTIELPTDEYVRSKFSLVKQFGPYAIYSFRN